MNYYKLTNRTSRKEQILSNKEFSLFAKRNNLRDYAITTELSPQDKTINRFLNTVAISCFSFAIVILISEMIKDIF